MLRFGRLGRFSNRLASFDADLTVVGAGPGGYVAAIKECLFIFFCFDDFAIKKYFIEKINKLKKGCTTRFQDGLCRKGRHLGWNLS